MTQRVTNLSRQTNETCIEISLNMDGSGIYDISTGIGFFDHMLEQLAKHSNMDLKVTCQGDLHIDCHHVVEDVGIALGQCIRAALGDCIGIQRFASIQMPMDETLTSLALDLNGRSNTVLNFQPPSHRLGDFETETVKEFLKSLSANGKFTLHVNLHYGENTHHIIESIFKGLAICLRRAKAQDNGSTIPSTKGII